MSNYLTALNLDLSAKSESGKHRREVFASTPWAPAPTTTVSYTAANRLLIIADPETAGGVEARLPEKLLCYVAIPSQHSGPTTTANAHHCAGLIVSGYLGRFGVMIDRHDAGDPAVADARNNLAGLFNIESGLFDQVLDCGDEPLVAAAIKPPGYHHAGRSEAALDAAVEEIPALIGEFEKPKYFHYNPDICAHGRSGIGGCTRCIDACASDAIFSLTESIAESIKVIPHLCQGLGACAGSCPTGAISYTYPKAAEQIEFLRVMLGSIRQKNGNHGVTLLVFDNEHGRASVEAAAAQFAGHVLPLVVEEIGSVGLDLISSALAYGANRVCLYVPADGPADIPAQVVAVLERNLSVVAAVIDQTRIDTHRAEIITDLRALAEGDRPGPLEHAATFAPVGDKRSIIRAALSFFSEISPSPPAELSKFAPLPAGSPFGQIQLNAAACTLCMGCVSVCPAGALQAGGDTPALKFIEGNCVQCGICANACPENAVTLETRLHFDRNVVNTPRVLKEETPFRCISCGKAFATRSMITRMTEKLQGHWMFDQPESLNRLQMCEDCRVKDLFEQENARS